RDRQDVAVENARTPPPFVALRLRRVAHLKIGTRSEAERVDGDQLSDQVVLHVAAHAAHDRDDGNEERHADRHADHAEEALELLHANGIPGEGDRLKEGHEPPYVRSEAIVTAATARAGP